MKGVEALEILYVTAKLRDRVMRDEMLVFCVTAERWYGAKSSEHDETLVMYVTAKRGVMTLVVASGFV